MTQGKTMAVALSVGCMLSLAVGPAPAAAPAAPAEKPDPENCTWNLSFESFFSPDKRGRTRPMKIYPARRGGKWVHALGSSPTWNKCCHTVDLSGLTFADGSLRGALKVTLHPDPWIPRDGKCARADLRLDAKVDRKQPENDGAIQGTYRGTFAGKEVSGKLTGRLSVPEMTPLSAARFRFAMTDALAGGKNAWDRRLAVQFDLFDGKPTDGRFGQTDMQGNPKSLTPLEFTRLEVAEHGFTAEFAIRFEVIGAIEDPEATYHYKVAGRRVNDLLGGEFSVRVVRDNHKTVLKTGGFKGWVRPAAARARSIWARTPDDRPWFVPVKGFKPPRPGEHPRLFFRKDDLPDLRKRAATPTGRAILARLRATLGGGEEMPKHSSASKVAYDRAAGKQRLPEGAYTISHAAGFGLLYQLTGKGKYADLARKCMELGFKGVRDRDDRYAWSAPGGELRAGPSIAWYALAYDLCYDGWDDAFRRDVALRIQNYDDGRAGEWGKPEGVSLHALAMMPKQSPGSNHYGSVVGGAGLAVLAVLGDPGTDEARLKAYLRKIERNTVIALTRGFGDHGYFAEGPGPSHVAANTALVPFLQAMKTAAGRDYISPRPNARWMTLRWAMELVPDANGKPHYPCRKPSNYGGPDFLRPAGGMSHGGWFSQGFGAVREQDKPALLWVYNHFVAKADRDRFTTTNYPHRAVLALVNWPIGVEPKNPAQVLPKAVVDKIHGYCVFRNRWQDADDILVTVLLGGGPEGHIKGYSSEVAVWGLGRKIKLGRFGHNPAATYYKAAKDGSGVVAASDGNCLAVDFSKASGADALVVTVGPGAQGGRTVSAGGTTFHILTLQAGPAPEIRTRGDNVLIGGQTVRHDGKKLILDKMAPP